MDENGDVESVEGATAELLTSGIGGAAVAAAELQS